MLPAPGCFQRQVNSSDLLVYETGHLVVCLSVLFDSDGAATCTIISFVKNTEQTAGRFSSDASHVVGCDDVIQFSMVT